MAKTVSARIELEGIVQGVGFRPFIHRLSRRFFLTGFVLNTSDGVLIEAEGIKADIENFYSAIQKELPALARIIGKKITFSCSKGYSDFSIKESLDTDKRSALVCPDISICEDCKDELLSANDRRYLYPFINCTNCGPRFSIIKALPYDRPNTTMAAFRMCPECKHEYDQYRDRRYHAQPNACHACGPSVELLKISGRVAKTLGTKTQAIKKAIRLLKSGEIIAVKGIGGFHIACDADDIGAIRRLRRLKNRPSKPFAVMVRSLDQAKRLCRISCLEEEILLSPERPIVLLEKRSQSRTARLIAPDNNYLGVMICYAPLHHLLFLDGLSAGRPLNRLIMTSGNIADEPIEIDNSDAIKNLSGICKYFLINDRDIYNRVDDSIVQVIDKKPVVLRRSRGYSPFPFIQDKKLKEILACGAELKNTFCLTKGRYAFLSQYIGDLKTLEAFQFYKEAILRMKELFSIKPRVIACDLHPDYLSTDYCSRLKDLDPSLKIVAIQHHHAHIASVIAEHRLRTKVIGVCCDGIGLGVDDKIWGGEFFVADLKGFRRIGHFDYVAMPGGDKATQEPFRMAISYLYKAFGDDIRRLNIGFIKKHGPKIESIIKAAKAKPLLTSSVGRLFDAVSALLGICDIISYEAQAAIRLQMFAERSKTKKSYSFLLKDSGNTVIVDTSAAIRQIVYDLYQKTPKEDIARKFHNGISSAITKLCVLQKDLEGIKTVALSGGVFQNKLLLETTILKLGSKDFNVYYNQLLPTNDGAISLGQAVIANEIIRFRSQDT